MMDINRWKIFERRQQILMIGSEIMRAKVWQYRDEDKFRAASLVTYPARILQEKARRVEIITPKIQELGSRMVEAMLAYQGIGLAAPQVGVSLRVIVVQDGESALVCVNPEITQRSKEEETEEEGCLSIPSVFLPIRRSSRVTVAYQDINGERTQRSVGGLVARIFQHEIDHLNGILIIKRVGFWTRWKLRARLRNIHG
ncbi:MAG: peptide deformylase [Candidatus Wildermuthbacteria bacterium]|nr:peptide deformylase [Candidatus Wildermuthbacteria bacterium]